MPLVPFLSSLTATRATSAFPGFEKDGDKDATAIAFSPDGSTLYIATDEQRVYAMGSNGGSSAEWWETVSDANICDMAVSPDGVSVSFSSCSASMLEAQRCESQGGSRHSGHFT